MDGGLYAAEVKSQHRVGEVLVIRKPPTEIPCQGNHLRGWIVGQKAIHRVGRLAELVGVEQVPDGLRLVFEGLGGIGLGRKIGKTAQDDPNHYAKTIQWKSFVCCHSLPPYNGNGRSIHADAKVIGKGGEILPTSKGES